MAKERYDWDEDFDDEELEELGGSVVESLLVWLDRVVRAEIHRWLEENKDDILAVLKEGIQEGTVEFWEDIAKKAPAVFASFFSRS